MIRERLRRDRTAAGDLAGRVPAEGQRQPEQRATVLGSSFAHPRRPQRSMSVVPAVAAIALIALAACGPVASTSIAKRCQAVGVRRQRFARDPWRQRPPDPVHPDPDLGRPTDLHNRNGRVSGDRVDRFEGLLRFMVTRRDDHRRPATLASSRLLPATVNPDGTGYAVHTIGPPTLNLPPGAWSPDGNNIAFEGWDDTDPSRTGIYVSEGFTLAKAEPVQITQAAVHDIPLDWSPDGTRLLLIQVTRCPDGDCDGGDLYVVGSDGSTLTRLNPEGTFVSCCNPASWSPDGTRVTFGAPSLKAHGSARLHQVRRLCGRGGRLPGGGSHRAGRVHGRRRVVSHRRSDRLQQEERPRRRKGK